MHVDFKWQIRLLISLLSITLRRYWKIRPKLPPPIPVEIDTVSFNSRRDSRNFRAKPNRFTA